MRKTQWFTDCQREHTVISATAPIHHLKPSIGGELTKALRREEMNAKPRIKNPRHCCIGALFA
jgi:hypothetical protein